jgi:hypothetical protein
MIYGSLVLPALVKREAIVAQLVNRSAKADFKAIQILLGLLHDIEGDSDPHFFDPNFTEADRKSFNALPSADRDRARLARGADESSGGASSRLARWWRAC